MEGWLDWLDGQLAQKALLRKAMTMMFKFALGAAFETWARAVRGLKVDSHHVELLLMCKQRFAVRKIFIRWERYCVSLKHLRVTALPTPLPLFSRVNCVPEHVSS